jgi:hypothetical protein
VDAEWRGPLELMGPDILAEAEALEPVLVPPVFQRVLELLVTVDDRACADTLEEMYRLNHITPKTD